MPDSSQPGPHDTSRVRPGDSILDHIARRSGRAPKVKLRPFAQAAPPRTSTLEMHALQSELSEQDQRRYRILGEIARGGMGVVLRGHDVELGRDVAFKVADARLAQRPEVVERFVEEAQVGGQLQHPGIVPVYELGLMNDERPFFTMKLIEGRTLAEMLAQRESIQDDRVRFLGIFASVCQTLAYAHSKGVIHRDLKPANIMVGAFGEVQVVDWGLSKVLRDDPDGPKRDTAILKIETVRSLPGSDADSIVGNVLGTPAYMSPEQAQGETQALNERADVFALGAILCEILTGRPPYAGGGSDSVLERAARGELDDARARLADCDASDELQAVALRALAPARAERSRDAGELANAISTHLAGLERRVQEERVNAERSRRQTQLAVFAGVLSLVVLGGGGGAWWFFDHQRDERRADMAFAYGETRSQALAHERSGDFERALETARSGLRLLESREADDRLRAEAEALVESTRRRLEAENERAAATAREARLQRFFEDAATRHMFLGDPTPLSAIDASYVAALDDFGLDLAATDLGAQLAPLAGTPFGARIAQGLDGWARIVRDRARAAAAGERNAEASAFPVEFLNGLGLDLDPDPLRQRAREALIAHESSDLLEIARAPETRQANADTLSLLCEALYELNESAESLRVATLATDRYPDCFELQAMAGRFHLNDSLGSLDKAEQHLEAAVALRPELAGTHFRLAQALGATGDSAAAAVAAERALALSPDFEEATRMIGLWSLMGGRHERAIEYFDRYAASGSGSLDSDDLPRFARVLAGELDVDEYLAWIESYPSQTWRRWTRALLTATVFVAQGEAPQPERALEILEPYYDEAENAVDYQMILGTSYALLGDGSVPVQAAARLEALEPDNRFYSIVAQLLFAAGYRLLEDDTASEAAMRRARHGYADLTRGRENDWEHSPLRRAFDLLENVALGAIAFSAIA